MYSIKYYLYYSRGGNIAMAVQRTPSSFLDVSGNNFRVFSFNQTLIGVAKSQ